MSILISQKRPREERPKRPCLVVLPTDVVNAADWRPVSDRAVRSALVVVLEPVWQRCGAVSMRGVAEAVGPLAPHRSMETLDLAVGARRPRSRGEMSDPALG